MSDITDIAKEIPPLFGDNPQAATVFKDELITNLTFHHFLNTVDTQIRENAENAILEFSIQPDQI